LRLFEGNVEDEMRKEKNEGQEKKNNEENS
jgi:hypothetical protein